LAAAKRDVTQPLRFVPSDSRNIGPVLELRNEAVGGYGNYCGRHVAMIGATIVICESLSDRDSLRHLKAPDIFFAISTRKFCLAACWTCTGAIWLL
jgi:hypothetical protein